MDNSFSTIRVLHFARALFCENPRRYIWTLITIMALPSLMYCINLISLSSKMAVFGTDLDIIKMAVLTSKSQSVAIGLVVWVIFTTQSFKIYSSRYRGINALMLPVSKFEKFTFHFLLSAIISPLVISILITITNWAWSYALMDVPLNESMISLYNLDHLEVIFTICFIVFTHALFFFFSVLIRKTSKIIAVYAAIYVVFMTSFMDYNTSKELICILLAIGAIALWYLSWYQFTKLQITK